MVYYYCHRTHHAHQINLIMILQKLWGIGTCNRIRGIGIGTDLPSLTQPNNDIDIKTCLIISKNNSGINLHVRIHIKRYKTSKHKGGNGNQDQTYQHMQSLPHRDNLQSLLNLHLISSKTKIAIIFEKLNCCNWLWLTEPY